MASGPDPELLAAATASHLHAYCPYSHYRVGAAIRTGSGEVIVGCNGTQQSFLLTGSAWSSVELDAQADPVLV